MEAARGFVPVRVTNMADVDLSFYRFDFDLTYAALLMNADGTIYHTYGGRDWTDPMSHLQMDSFVSVLNATLEEHAEYQKDPKPPAARKKQIIQKLPWMAKRIKQGKGPECFHCHMVQDSITRDLRERKKWKRDHLWNWPDPMQLGITLDGKDQIKVRTVETGSAAARAGIKAGDTLRKLGDQRTLTFGDVQRVLHDAPAGKTALDVVYEHNGAEKTSKLVLKSGWKEADPLVFAWRPTKWPVSPKPGFGGRPLKPDELEKLGLPRDSWAFRVGYIVTWGDDSHTGRNAAQAGIRKGDVIASVGGKNDFHDMHHFHSWFRLTRKIGTKVPVVRIRNGKRETLELKVID